MILRKLGPARIEKTIAQDLRGDYGRELVLTRASVVSL